MSSSSDDGDACMSGPAAALQTALARTSLAEFLAARPPSTVVSVSDAQPLSAVLRVLDTHGILSAPVFAANSSRCVGFISVSDVLRSVLGWASLMDDPSPGGRAENLVRAGARLETTRVRDTRRANDGSLVLAASEGVSLLDVVRDGLLRGGRGAAPCHRVAVYDYVQDTGAAAGSSGGELLSSSPGAGLPGEPQPAFADASGAPLPPGADPTDVRVVAVVSQSDIVRFLARALAHGGRGGGAGGGGGDLATTPVSAIPGLASSPVVSVPADMPAALAFASLFSSEGVVSAAAVLETRGPGAGTLAATLSTADLRGMRPDGLAALAAPTLTYLSTRPARAPLGAAKTAAAGAGGGGPAKSAEAWGVRAPDAGPGTHPLRVEVVSPATTLGDVIARLADAGTHRVYVCDDTGRPTGVITLTDVLRVVAGAGSEEGVE